MEAYKGHLIKVAILYLSVSMASIYFAYTFLKLFKKHKNKLAKTIAFLLAVWSIAASVMLPYNILPDVINYNPQTTIAKVIDSTATYQSSSIKEEVYLDNGVSYNVYFYNVDMRKGRQYKIIYTPKSRIILDALEITN